MKQRSVLNFTVIFTQDEDGVFIVDCPAIPGCHSQGDTYEEAARNIEEAIFLCLRVAADDSSYRDSIEFPSETNAPRFVGVSDIAIPVPSFV